MDDSTLTIHKLKSDRAALVHALGDRHIRGDTCRCPDPSHDDAHPSAGIFRGDDGSWKVKCHSCGWHGDMFDVTAAITGRPLADILREARVNGNGKAAASAPPATLDALAALLGASVAALEAQGTHRGVRCWRTPERDAAGNVIGHALRLDKAITISGKVTNKLSEKGGRRGLTMAWPIDKLAGTISDDPILIVEGGSDQAAGNDLGFVTIGRPSATGGLDLLRPLAKAKHVCIVGENDDAGRDGAAKIAAGLAPDAASVKTIFPPPGVKDLRAWTIAGLTGHELREIIKAAEPWAPPAADPPLAWRPFPVDALPDPLRSFVMDAAKAIGSDASFIILPALAVAASCIGNNYRVILKRGWTEPAILWCCAIGESGTLKSPGFKAVLRRVREVQQKLIDEHRKAMEEHAGDMARHEAAEKKWKGAGCVGDAPVAPEPPPLRRLIVSDCTVESLAPILLANPRGVLLARDELAGWIGAFDRYAGGKGSDAPNWLSMYDGETVIVDRKSGSPPTIYVPSASVSVTGTIQPGTLARVFSAEQRDNGMLARLLLAMPPGKPARWSDAEVSEAVEKRFATMIDSLLALAPGVDEEGRPRPRLIGLDAHAKATFIAWHDRHAGELAELTGDLAAAFSKLKGACARLALIFHCCRVADGDATLADPSRIDLASVESAIALVEWFKHEARRIYAMLSEGDEGRERRQLVEWIDRKGGAVAVRDLTHGLRQFRGDTAGARKALEGLADEGAGRWEQVIGPKGGRPSERFRLGTSVTVTETPISAGNGEGNGSGDSGDVLESETNNGDGWGEEGVIE